MKAILCVKNETSNELPLEVETENVELGRKVFSDLFEALQKMNYDCKMIYENVDLIAIAVRGTDSIIFTLTEQDY